MAHPNDPSNDKLNFHWGKKRGVGGSKKDIRFYESFVYDNVSYSLYDCVYLYKADEAEPFIGKLVKIWEQPDHKKKVKILWFFRPSEIKKYLRDHEPLEKEIFLACGEGVGLFNINPLEAIAGKCLVICTSKDERNPQPTKEELEMADYIFYRTFNVQNYSLSENIEDKIAGVEVKFLLNLKENMRTSCGLELKSNDFHGNGQNVTSAVSHTLSKSDSERISDNKVYSKASTMLISSEKVDNIRAEPVNKEESLNRSQEKVSLDKDGVIDTGNRVAENPLLSKVKDNSSVADDKPSEKMRLVDDAAKPSMNMMNMQNTIGSKMPKVGSDDGYPLEKTSRSHKESSDEPKLSTSKSVPLAKTVQKVYPASSENIKKPANSLLVVARRQDADRSKWFKGLPWEDRLQQADNLGTLVFFQNLDPSYTSSEVEDIIYHSLELSCTAKVIQQTAYHNPNYGQAYAIFKSREAADSAVSKINSKYLLQPNGRPVVCSKGILKAPKPSMSGHLSIDKLKLQMREGMKKAVSTSHCSQPNTIEYEMSMDWILSQEKFYGCLKRLHKEQVDEDKQTKKHFKLK